jgi:hypothetical protein
MLLILKKLFNQKRIHLLLLVGLLTACTGSPTLEIPATSALPTILKPTLVETLPFETSIPSTAIPAATSAQVPTETSIPSPTPTPTPLRFAVIGDFGQGEQGAAEVAKLVKSWQPELIITTGDNNYPSGAAETIDQNIGQFYHEFIYPYQGVYGSGADRLRFFPTLGNHDWDTNRAQAHFDYFELPGNERYYDFVWGPVHFFALSADSREPDGVSAGSIQAMWLKEALSQSNSPWKIVYMHQPPYSSGPRGPVTWMRWPFLEWGASLIMAGHDHYYERLNVDGLPVFINGLGGGPIYSFGEIAEGSQVRFNHDYGAMLVVCDESKMTLQFITRAGIVVDTFTLEK